MKNLLAILLTVLLLPVAGRAADSAISGLPNRTPALGDYTVVTYPQGGAWYNGKVSLLSLSGLLGGSEANTVTNFYVRELTVYSSSYFYETNFNNYEITTNLNVVNNFTVESNAWFYETNFNNYEYTTNLTVLNEFNVESNAYFFETNFNNYSYTTNLTVLNEFNVESNAYFFETNFNNYEFTTNLTVLNEFNVESNAYFFETNFNNYEFTTNLNVLNEFTVQSNAYFFETNFNNYEITTNLTVLQEFTVQSNAYFYYTNFVSYEFVTNMNVKNLNVTNLYYQAANPLTNTWANGPTGVVDLAISDVYYAASADMEISGVANKPTTSRGSVLLMILASGANRTVYLGAGIADGAGATSYVATNGVPLYISLTYTPAMGGWTNAVNRSFWR